MPGRGNSSVLAVPKLSPERIALNLFRVRWPALAGETMARQAKFRRRG